MAQITRQDRVEVEPLNPVTLIAPAQWLRHQNAGRIIIVDLRQLVVN